MASRYPEIYARWKADPAGFWLDAARAIDWFEPPTTGFDPTAGVYGRWFPDAVGNVSHNCIDRHVAAGRGDQPAIVYESPISGRRQAFTFRELLAEVEATAAVLADEGVGPGDRVVIYMPMVPEAVFAMLACARLGAIHSVVFGGFAANELATRIDDARPKLVVSASCGLEPGRIVAYKPLLDAALDMATHKPDRCLVLQRPQREAELAAPRDRDLGERVAAAKAAGRRVPAAAMKATDPLYILYTSGTTGQPKGVVRDGGGMMVALAWSMSAIYGLKAGDVFFTASDIGWVVGHSYIVYGPLLAGCTTILFEGKPVGTPDAGTFWRIVAENRVRALFTAPTALRAIKKEDPRGEHVGGHDISSLETVFLAGERADPDTIHWAEAALGVPVVDHWWQTETGWAIAANPAGLGLLPTRYGSPAMPMPGYAVEVLDDAGHPVAPGTLGNVVIRLPLPPGCLPTLWGSDSRFRSSYLDEFRGCYKTSDAGYLDEDGYLFIMSRTDDIINVAGHRLSTGAMEEVLAGHPDVAECAVVGVADSLKGQAPCGFVVLKSGVTRPRGEIEAELVARVRDLIGPVAAFKLALTVDRLPKTRSGKILRATMRQIADGETPRVPATIDDPAVLVEIERALSARGLVRKAADPAA